MKFSRAGIPALTNFALDPRLLQELRSVSWLPQEPDTSYELIDLQKALAKQNHKAVRLLCHCLKLCTSVLHLVRGFGVL